MAIEDIFLYCFLLPIVVMLLGIFTLVRLVHTDKKELPIDITLFGIFTLVRLVHAGEKIPIVVSLSPIIDIRVIATGDLPSMLGSVSQRIPFIFKSSGKKRRCPTSITN